MTLPANLKVAALVSDCLYSSGLIADNTAQHLFDIMADALAQELPLCQIICNEVEFATEAFVFGTGEDAV